MKIIIIAFSALFAPLSHAGVCDIFWGKKTVSVPSALEIRSRIKKIGFKKFILETNSDHAMNAIEKGLVDVWQKDEKGRLPLHIVFFWRLLHFMQALLNIGADPNAKDDEGNAAIHIAVNDHDFMSIKLLLNYEPQLPEILSDNLTAEKFRRRYKADINIQDAQGRTPVYLAIDNRFTSYRLVSFFIDNNADTTIPDNNGKTLLERAREVWSPTSRKYKKLEARLNSLKL